MKDTFSNMHPFINFIFFALTIGFTMFIMNPVCLAVSFSCALVTALYLNGKKAVRLSLVFLLPMILLIVLINPVFNHEGMTILTYFPWDNPQPSNQSFTVLQVHFCFRQQFYGFLHSMQ